MASERVALVAGATGMVGHGLLEHLAGANADCTWTKLYGLSRRRGQYLPESVHHIECDLLDQEQCTKKLGEVKDVTHVFYAVWVIREREEDNILVNGEAFSNLLDHLNSPLVHVVLVTGTKHYLGPFDMIDKMDNTGLPFKETKERLPLPNFFYSLEDILFERAAKGEFSWSVARPSAIIGFAPVHQCDIAIGVAVYATICKYLQKPFVFPGSAICFNDTENDFTSADLLAKHLEWQATSYRARNEAFNIVNGDVYKWRTVWDDIGKYFDLTMDPVPGANVDYLQFMSENAKVWDDIVEKYQLKPFKLNELVQGWFGGVILQFHLSFYSDMSKARERGFTLSENTHESFRKVFERFRKERIIP